MENVHEIAGCEVHTSWDSLLSEEVINYLQKVDEDLEPESFVTPVRSMRLRFLSLDLSKAKIVILGQDPYPQPGIATGRAFEVGGLESWTHPFRNTSLRNIVRALYASANEGEIINFNDIKKQLETPGGFRLLAPNRLFEYWEQQGVLLLNTSFTCRLGKPRSHSKIWNFFSQQLLNTINVVCPDLTWLLWGNHARHSVTHMNLRNLLVSNHPMICHQRPDDFLFGAVNHFKATADLVDWIGEKKSGH